MELPSKELIFRVKSPVKLYWVAQIYDIYNGSKWTFSNSGKKHSSRKILALNSKITHYDIETKFIMEKWLSPKLYFAYRPTDFAVFKSDTRRYSYRMSPFNAVLTEKKYPPLALRL